MSRNIIDIKTNDQFNQVISGNELMVILFSADWAEQCKHVLDAMEELLKQSELQGLQYLKVPAEDLSDISFKYKIEAVPTIIFLKDRKQIDRIDGVDIAKLTQYSKKYGKLSTNTETKTNNNKATKINLEDRLKQLINKSDIMLFMKGDRTTPRCGFSKQIIAIIESTKIPFETFDILTDEEVRQGLKTYSDWPTYPQVYVKGELIGGLDIIKELSQSGELEVTLKG